MGTGNGGGGNGPINSRNSHCVSIQVFVRYVKIRLLYIFHYANTYLCASLSTCHVLSYDFTSFSLHQGWRKPPQERFFSRRRNDTKRSKRKLKEKKKKCRKRDAERNVIYIYIYSLLNIISRGDDEIKNGWTLIHTYIYVYIYIYVYTYIYKYTYNIILSVSRGWNNWVWREKKKKICIFFSHLVAYICIQLEYIKRLRE